jgi:hypothetical protein
MLIGLSFPAVPHRIVRKATTTSNVQHRFVPIRIAKKQRTKETLLIPYQCGTRIGVMAVEHCAYPANHFRTAESASNARQILSHLSQILLDRVDPRPTKTTP